MAEPETAWWTVVQKLCGALSSDGFPPGDLAQLRRLDPDDPANFTFWRVMTLYAPHELARPGDDHERRWKLVLWALATLNGLHDPHKPLGGALGEAGFSELRLSRLLRAEDDTLAPEIRSATRYLASKGKPSDLLDFARLVLSPEGPQADKVRRRVAATYFSAVSTHANE
jgi:CRISPR system Cascade subunit CasB